ncbi:MAG TPA: hypothetical protein VK638_23295 [Edaphobacter sp.]|nr:hypothetical protein [Edaphobacter sp.]
MIEQATFLGMPIRTHRQRQLLVIVYYLFVLCMGLFYFWIGWRYIWFAVPQMLTLGGLFGGIKIGGPVKFYNDRDLSLSSGIQSLNLSRPFSFIPALDEREKARRDAAHFLAYRILIVSLFLMSAAVLVPHSMSSSSHYTWVAGRVQVVFLFLVIYAVSLPQSVLLWTEPQDPVADLIEMPPSQTS